MASEAPVEVGPVPEFSFTERSGRTVTLADLKGKVWTAAFFFTRCTTICIPMNLEMKELQDEFLDEPDFMIVATTVEPDHDTPKVLQAHAKRYGALPDRWWFLTGPIDDVKKFAHDGLKIQWHPDSPLLHSPYFVLVDRGGTIRGYYNQTDADAMTRLRGDILWLLKHKDAQVKDAQ